jgi:hypothetical protein
MGVLANQRMHGGHIDVDRQTFYCFEPGVDLDNSDHGASALSHSLTTAASAPFQSF